MARAALRHPVIPITGRIFVVGSTVVSRSMMSQPCGTSFSFLKRDESQAITYGSSNAVQRQKPA